MIRTAQTNINEKEEGDAACGCVFQTGEKMGKEVIKGYPRLLHGGDYNPDQWLDRPDILEEDVRLMKESHVNCVSLGIFAWAKLEPAEGEFQLDWLEKIIDRLYENGIYTFLATPSGALPQWMAAKYEEVRQVTEEGVRRLPGERHNFCPSSPVMRRKMKTINQELSRRLGKHPGVLLWHISNEYGGNKRDASCHCPYCQEAFRSWLKDRYKTLDALNHAWWSAFWSHTYTDWSQIHSPGTYGETRLQGLTLDWKRFVSHQMQDFCREEIEAVREFSDRPAAINMMDFFEPLDYYRFAPQLDIISWDSYPAWQSEKDDVNVAMRTAACHTLMRSLKKEPFLLMESTPSIVNWKDTNTQKRPGMHMLSSMQAVACGSNSVQYFQWRKSRGSCEKFHGAVVGHRNGSNTRTFREVTALGRRLEEISDRIYHTCNRPRAAIVFDWENWWALEGIQGPRKDMAYKETVIAHFKPFWEMGIEVDFINEDDSMEGYDFVTAPMAYLYKDGYADRVREFVKKGGVYLTTYFSGVADQSDLCILEKHPLEDVLGIRTEEMDAADETILPNSIRLNQKSWQVGCQREVSHTVPDEKGKCPRVLAYFEQDYYTGFPALTVREYGEGRAYYLACETEEGFLRELYGGLMEELGLTGAFTGLLPYGVTVSERKPMDGEADGASVWFLQNFNASETDVQLPFPAAQIPEGTRLEGTITLNPYECLILERA